MKYRLIYSTVKTGKDWKILYQKRRGEKVADTQPRIWRERERESRERVETENEDD